MSEPAPAPLPLVEAHFPAWTPAQHARLARYAALLREWNGRLNLVSRKDAAHLEEHHLLTALGLAKVVQWGRGARVLDVGTGGGLPGIPLAIAFPQAKFFLVDSMEKKVKAVRAMVEALALTNVEVVHKRAETIESKFDFVVGRAVAPLPEIFGWVAKNLRAGAGHGLAAGFLYLKGDRFAEELASVGTAATQVWRLDTFFDRPYFADKYAVHVALEDVPERLRQGPPKVPKASAPQAPTERPGTARHGPDQRPN